MSNIIIGLHGKAGSGKNTAALLLKDDNFSSIAFADPIRRAVADILGVPVEMLEDRVFKETVIEAIGKSPRQMMQTLGTEWGREQVNPDLWLILAAAKIRNISGLTNVFITDVRFENEAKMIRSMGGYVVEIIRNDVSEVAAHVSEKKLPSALIDYWVLNKGTKEDLTRAMRHAVKFLKIVKEEEAKD